MTTRRGNGWRQNVATLADGNIEFQMIWDDADNGFRNVSYCFLNNIPLIAACFDGDANKHVTGYRIQGLYAEFTIADMSREEALEEGMMANVSIQIAPGATPPEWVDRVVG